MAVVMAAPRAKRQGAYTNTKGQRIWFIRNPESWLTRYSVWGNGGKGWGDMLVSHHRTRERAMVVSRRLKNKNILKVLGWK